MGFGIPVFSVVVVSMAINILALTGPLFMLQVYDRVLASRSLPTLIALAGLVVVLYAFLAVLDAIRSRITIRAANLIDENWSQRVFRAVVRMRLTPGASGADPVRDLDTLRQVTAAGAPVALLDLPWVPVYLFFVFLLHPVLGWVATAGALMIAALLVVSEFAMRRPTRGTVEASTRRQVLSDDTRSNVEAVHAMGMLADLTNLWNARNDELSKANCVSVDRSSLFASISRSFRYFLQSAVLGVGAYLVIRGELTGGMMIGASMISARALAPIDRVVAQYRGLISARGAFRRIRELLKVATERPHDVELPLPSHSIALSGVGSGPDRKVGPLVSGISFELEAGDGLGVLGMSGSGKSTLVRAIAGIWPTLLGEIRLDDAALQHYDPDRLGKAIGYLPQSVDLFSGTIAQNISRFRPDAASEDILAAAQSARCHEFVLSFEDGYDTQVGELGSRLSAGQRQRIGLARALFGNPFLILLDEPNSNLDAAGDEALSAAVLSARARGAIVIVVAHRPSAIAAVNKLLYLQDGRQLAFGDKQQVLEKVTRPPSRPQPVPEAARPAVKAGA